MDRRKTLDQLRKMLKADRYLHTLSTEKKALELAAIYGVDAEKASTAALLHDCAKNFSEEETEKYMGLIDEETRKVRKVLHAPLSALVARKEFGVEDTEILDAIRYHTTGRENMSLLEKIIFIADAVEDRRDYPGVEILRELSVKDPDDTMIEYFNQLFPLRKDTGIHSDSIKAFEFLMKEKEKKDGTDR